MSRELSGLTILAVVAVACGSVWAGIDYPDPIGGWTYIYTGDAAANGADFLALDGKWSHDNGSDSWDGSIIGAGVPGGVMTQDGYLRIQDCGDPRDHGASDPSNRKVMFGHSVTNDVTSAVANTLLDDGVTISFRARIATGTPLDDLKGDGGSPTGPWPAGGDGYVLHDGGKGNFSIRQPTGDKIISFSLVLASEHAVFSSGGLTMNNLNGASPSGDVDTGEGGTTNLLDFDPTEWHEFWITIEADDTGTGTHKVSIYYDGVVDPVEFIVTAGDGNDYDDCYLGMGCGATGQSGAIDVDFYAYKPGINLPPGGILKARTPVPANGAQNVLQTDNSTMISWSGASGAMYHHLYYGTDRDAVENATETSPEHLQKLLYTMKFYPAPRQANTTYYWRIDEEDTAGEVFKGDVWTFTTAPLGAHSPNPADGARFIGTGTQLVWSPGFDSFSYDVYFGTSPDALESKGTTMAPSHSPGPLLAETDYYWRIDATGATTVEGPVWKFRTAKVGGGLRGMYYNWVGTAPPSRGAAFANLALSRLDPQIDFSWGDTTSPDPLIGLDNFAARWVGELEIAFTETYTFYTSTDDGVRLWVDGQELVDDWEDQGTTENSGTIDLSEGQIVSVVMEYYENGGGAVAQLRWSSPSTPKQLIPQGAFSPPFRATVLSPGNGATNVDRNTRLLWMPGEEAATHHVYFGTDETAVGEATTSTFGIYKGQQDANEWTPPTALGLGQTYYWRIDEANGGDIWKGSVWSFTVANFLGIDDFESYTDYSPGRIFEFWKDGYGYGEAPPNPGPYYPGNGTGSIVGYDVPPFAELAIVHGGDQAMPYFYNNNNPVKAKYSEATLALTGATRNWSADGVKALSLWFRGNPASVGGFSYNAGTGVFTVTGAGADIWDIGPAGGPYHDEFHFVYKVLNGAGSITAQVLSVENTNAWAKAGVMIRNTLDPNSAHAMMVVSPSSGIAGQLRMDAGGDSQGETVTGITAPYWVRIERDIQGYMGAWYSPDNSDWTQIGDYYLISMNTPMYIGLAVTSHNVGVGCDATFGSVTTTGSVTGNWASQDIGITSNDAEPMYVRIANSNGISGVVVHPDPAVVQTAAWTEWNIDLRDFINQGVSLADVNSLSIGFGNRSQPVAGGAGTVYFDDIRLYRARYVPGMGTALEGDVDNDGLVSYSDIEILGRDWLAGDDTITASPPDSAGLVLHWAFNEGFGTSAGDSSGKGNAGVLDGPTWTSPGSNGTGYCLDFSPDANDQVVNNDANSFINGLDAMSVSIWVKSRRIGTDKGFIIFADPDGTDQRDIRYDAAGSTAGEDNVIKYGLTSTGGSQQNETSANVQTTEWQHLVMTWSSGQVVRLYINGVLDVPSAEASATVGTITGYTKVIVGRGGKDEVSSAWDGLIDDVRIYNYALSDSEVLNLAGLSDLYIPITSPAEIYDSEPINSRKVDFKDYSMMAEDWLKEQVWPEW